MRKDGYSDEYDFLPEAQALFQEYFTANLKASELNGFIQQSYMGQNKFHITKDWLETFFATWEDFEEYLNTSDNIKSEIYYYAEFIEFYKKYKENEYKPVEFEFKYLKPKMMLPVR